MFQALIKIPASDYWNDEGSSLPDEVLKVIDDTSSQFTNDPAWNTRIYEGYKLVNFIGNSSLEKLATFILLFELDWEIMAANDGYTDNEEGDRIVNTLLGYDPAVLINYIQRKRVYDVDGNFIEEAEPDTIEFGRFAGYPILEAK